MACGQLQLQRLKPGMHLANARRHKCLLHPVQAKSVLLPGNFNLSG